jgi:hypothetical protein
VPSAAPYIAAPHIAAPHTAEPTRAPEAPAGRNGNPAYRDWTRPSGSGAAPATTAIPDREIARGRAEAPAPEVPATDFPATDFPATDFPATQVPAMQVPATEVPGSEAYAERFADEDDDLAREPGSDVRNRVATEPPAARGPASGSQTGVVGGRAALREGRRAAEDERRKTARRNGVPHVRTPVPGTEEDEPRAPRRRSVGALIAVVVLALVVLGVYSFASPETQEASDGQQQPVPTTSAPVVTSGALPPLTVAPLPPVDDIPATPVRIPVTVLNATNVTGLAGDIADVLEADGWTTLDTGAYGRDDVPVTTVYYTDGDEEQRQSAEQLRQLHPEVATVAIRFFEVPDVADPGLVVVAAGDWQP